MTKTKIDFLNELAALDAVKANTELADFVAGEIYLLEARKMNRKPTKTQTDNEKIKVFILDGLKASDTPIRVKDLRALPTLQDYTSQKITALLNQLVKAGQVIRIVDKKVTTFEIAK